MSHARGSLILIFLFSVSSYSQPRAAAPSAAPQIGTTLKHLVVSPSALTFYSAPNTPYYPPTQKQTLTVTSGDGTALSFTAIANTATGWLTVITPNLTDSATTPVDILIKETTSALTVGTYSGTVTITALTPGVLNSPVVIPVTLIMTPPNTLVVSDGSVALTQTSNAVKPPAQSVSVIGTTSLGTPITFASVVTYGQGQGQGWLTVSQSSATTPSTLTITANGSGLAAGSYTAQILLISAGVTSQAVNVTLTLGSAAGGFSSGGSMAHFAAEGNWVTRITLVNNGTTSAQAHLNFFDDDGNAIALPLVFPQTSLAILPPATTVDRTLNPGAVLTIQTAGPDSQPTQAGWIQLLSNGNIGGFAVFKQLQDSGEPEAVVPLETRNAGSYVLYFDHTTGYVTGVALANIATQPANVALVIRDDAGTVMQSDHIPLAAQGHTAFVLSDSYPVTAQRRGTIEFQTPAGGQINVLGLSFSPSQTFTTIPPLAK